MDFAIVVIVIIVLYVVYYVGMIIHDVRYAPKEEEIKSITEEEEIDISTIAEESIDSLEVKKKIDKTMKEEQNTIDISGGISFDKFMDLIKSDKADDKLNDVISIWQ